MARDTEEPERFRRITLEASVEDVTKTSPYSSDERELATLKTTIRLGGRFDRESVATLVTNIVNALVDAFDEGVTEPRSILAVERDPGLEDVLAGDRS